MKLIQFLRDNNLGYSEFGRRIGTSHEAVRRYALKGQAPASKQMRAVIRETGGAVRPNDFFDIPAGAAD
jgi:hypothetical protein